MREHDATGRTYNRPRSRKMRRGPNSPPENQGWAWIAQDLLESAAWVACPDVARRVLFVVVREHVRHAGKDNGRLPVTWRDLRREGVRQGGIKQALDQLQLLGLLRCTGRGRPSNGRDRGSPATWALTWLPIIGEAQPTNGWKEFKTVEEAKAALKSAKASAEVRTPLPGEDIDSDTDLVPERPAVSVPIRAAKAA